MTLLEAMSWGIPCICADCVSGPGDMIQLGVNGHLYQPGELRGFINLLDKYISGEISLAHNVIPASIGKFYQPIYYDRLQKIIVSAISRRK